MKPPPISVLENVPLAPLTTLGVGGPARYFFRARSEPDIAAAFEFARRRDVEVFVMGGGSNILVSDTGFDGLVLQIGIRGIVTAAENDSGASVLVTAAAGEDWDKLVGYCVDRDLAGIECLSGIPGFVGGTPVQNVGAYGQEVSETIVAVRCYDRSTGRILELQNRDCGFAYRSSIFNSTHRNSYIVLAVTFRLVKGGDPKIVYKDLAEHLAGEVPSLRGTRAAVLAIRGAKSMVIDPGDPNSKSAGSFFKNPIVSADIFDSIASAYGPVPHFPASDGAVKIPAAWLIEKAGFHKGYVLGNAGISTNHSLAIINRGGASAAEIMTLKDRIAAAVHDRFGIELTPEPVFVGY